VSDCGSMVETIRVRRWCALATDCPSSFPAGLVQFKISYVMAAGFQREDRHMFDGMTLLKMPVGSVPMMTPIYTLPFDGHPGACTVGMAYLVRTYDLELGLQDVVARFVRRPQYHDLDPDSIFEMPPLEASGENIFPLPIEDEPY
jgi:hypothetical protein